MFTSIVESSQPFAACSIQSLLTYQSEVIDVHGHLLNMPLASQPEKTLSVAGGNTRRLLGPSRPGSSSGQNNSQQQNGVVRSSAPPQAANVAQEKLSVEQAKALKMQPPNTLQPRAQSMAMKRQTSQSTEEEKDNDRPSNTSIKREPGQNPFGVQAVQVSAEVLCEITSLTNPATPI